ncbi:MAG: sigma-70 family RNA polymerase sigma factor [candidate division Zixibacteria bacterium]|nr:sigma-70 family RNA polymerase sigma factor [candidate division Zixibacteria bacterium]
MSKSRISYQNWIVDIGYDPLVANDPQAGIKPHACLISKRVLPPDAAKVELVRQVVESALESLSSDEREFVVRFHYMGQSYRRISEESGRAIYKLAALHNRALRKLKAGLAPFVRQHYAIKDESDMDCMLCRSPYREEIDRIIDSRDPESTWRPVIRQLRERFDIRIGSPQLLIGHARYHRNGGT